MFLKTCFFFTSINWAPLNEELYRSFIGPEIFMKIVHAKSQSLCLEAGYPHFCHFSDVMHVTLVLGFILIKLKKVDLWHLSWFKLRHAGTKYSLFYYDSFHRFCVASPQTLKNGARIVKCTSRGMAHFPKKPMRAFSTKRAKKVTLFMLMIYCWKNAML